MKIIYNNILPFKGFKAINLFGVLFARKGANITQTTINHESIHTEQMKELLYLLFYIWYIIEWLIRLFLKGNAYRNSLLKENPMQTRMMLIIYQVESILPF